MIQFIDYLKEKQQGISYFFYFVIFAVIIGSFMVDTSHAHTWAEKNIPGFWSIFGVVSCFILIFFARWLAKAGITKEENYYDN
ncbi:MAG: hypothetical protein HKP41_09535 [Desulfobacterales bacterium]|nr:hypothetical protein [Desulfobacterales bacterium]